MLRNDLRIQDAMAWYVLWNGYQPFYQVDTMRSYMLLVAPFEFVSDKFYIGGTFTSLASAIRAAQRAESRTEYKVIRLTDNYVSVRASVV